MMDTSVYPTITKKKILCRIAGLIYEIECGYDYTLNKFKDYRIEPKEIDGDVIPVTYNERDLEDVLKLSPEAQKEHQEYLCIFDKIASMLPEHEMILMHGALIEYNGEGFLFTAPSGTGKTTHISLWKKYLGDKVIIVNGDKPELVIRENSVLAYGTPWCGKEGWHINKSVPLKGICLIQRGSKNKIKQISPGKYIELFIQQLYFDMGSSEVLKVFEIFNKITERVPFFLLECDISEEAAKCSFEKMTGKEWR